MVVSGGTGHRGRVVGGGEVGLQRGVLLGETFDVSGEPVDLGLEFVDLGRVGSGLGVVRRCGSFGVGKLVSSRLELVVELDAACDRHVALAQCEVALGGGVIAAAARAHPEQPEDERSDRGDGCQHDERSARPTGGGGVGCVR